MEKLGVVLDDTKIKEASEKEPPLFGKYSMRCPKCKNELFMDKYSTPNCPTCGTEPWEKK